MRRGPCRALLASVAVLALLLLCPFRAEACGTSWVVAIVSYVPQTVWHEYFSFETMIMIRVGFLSSDNVKEIFDYQRKIEGLLLKDVKAKEREYKAPIKISTFYSNAVYVDEPTCGPAVLTRKAGMITDYISSLWKHKSLGTLQFKEDLENFITTAQPPQP